MRTRAGFFLAAALGACGLLTACDSGTPVDPQQEVIEGLDHVVDPTRVAQIELTTPVGFDSMLAAYYQGDVSYVDAGFRFGDEELDSVGFRLVASPGSTKKHSLRITFREFGGPRFHGLERLHFFNNDNDPSLMREFIFSRALRVMGVPAPRASYAWVRVDGQDKGLYTMVPRVDDRLMVELYGTDGHADDGNLYKCEPGGTLFNGCSLQWYGDQKSDYLVAADDNCVEKDGCGLVLKSNEDDLLLNDYADLIDFLDFLNNSSEAEFAAGIEARFDVDAFLRYLAVAVALGDNTGYLGDMENFYLYHRPDTDQFVFIPWDHNKSMGLAPCPRGVHFTGSSAADPECTDTERPLVDRILAVETYRATYRVYLQEVLDTVLNPVAMQAWVDELETLIVERVPLDPTLEFTLAEHQVAISNAVGSEDFNLMQFVEERFDYLAFMQERK